MKDPEVVEFILRRLDLGSLGLTAHQRAGVTSRLETAVIDGVCSFDFHVAPAEFREDGTCEACGAPREAHSAALLCSPDSER